MTNVCRLILFGVALAVPSAAWAQVGPAADVLPDLSFDQLLGVKVYAAARHDQRPFDSPRSVSVITADEILRSGYRTVPEALNDMVGIVVQETNYGGGSPIIRGMIGNQVLILVDGVRMNNAIYRIGPNQYLNTVDVSNVERIEVVRGPGSVLYGSDALGGLINIVTKSRAIDGRGLKSDAAIRVASADRSTTGRLAVSEATNRVAVGGGISVKHYGDLRAGGSVGLQPFTGYDEWDGDLKVTAKLTAASRLEGAVQHLRQTDVDRTDLLLSGRNLEYAWNPQQHDLALVKYEAKPAGVVDTVSIVGSYRAQFERYDIVAAAAPLVRESHDDGVGSAVVSTQLSSSLPRQLATYGFEFSGDRVTSHRADLNVSTHVTTIKTPTFADGAFFRTLSFFAQDEIDVAARLALTLGLRESVFDLRAQVKNPSTGELVVDAEPRALTGSAYALYRLSPRIHLTAGVGQGFRAPNVNDTTVLGSFANGFEIPNPNVRAERAVEYKAGIKAQYVRFGGTATYYFTNYRDAIAVAPTATIRGLTFLDVNGNGVRDANEPDLYQRENTGSARIQGVEAEGFFRIAAALTASGNAAWTRGDDRVAGEPLRRIPPTEGMVRIDWTPLARLRLQVQNSFASRQQRLSPLDLSDARIGATGIPSFTVTTVRGIVDLSKRESLSVTVDNVTNSDYKLYGSGFKAPGVGVVLGYERRF
jgi:outer membrane receptor for ferrienterochelin and colicin